MTLVIGLIGKNSSGHGACHLPYGGTGRAAICDHAFVGKPVAVVENLERRISRAALGPGG